MNTAVHSAPETSTAADATTGVDPDGVYQLLHGFVPAHIGRRRAIEERVGRAATGQAIEALRHQAIANNPLGPRVQQIVQFAQLLIRGQEGGATRHAVAALRAGATFAELAGAAESGLLVSGMPAYNLGLRVVEKLERQAREAGIAPHELRLDAGGATPDGGVVA